MPTLPYMDIAQAASVYMQNFDSRICGDPDHDSYLKRFDLLARSLVRLSVTNCSRFNSEYSMVRSQCVFHLCL